MTNEKTKAEAVPSYKHNESSNSFKITTSVLAIKYDETEVHIELSYRWPGII